MEVSHHGGPEFADNVSESGVSNFGTLELRHIGRAHPRGKSQIHCGETRGQVDTKCRPGEVAGHGSNRFKTKMISSRYQTNG